MSTPSYYELWAKTGASPDQWHALPYHLIDVACCAEALWDSFPASRRRTVAEWLGTNEMTARSTVAFLAGSHDVGKANPFFQAKAVEHRSRLSAWKLMTSNEPKRHGQATYALLRDWLITEPELSRRIAKQIATPVASAVGGHHGHFFMDSDLSPLEVKDDPWKSEAFQVLDLLHQVFPVSLATLRKQEMKIFVGWLSGFVTVADWIGSHERMVIFQSAVVDLRHYVEGARLRASAAVRALGLESPAPTAPLALPDLLPVGAEPNALQRVTDDVARSEPQLTIIEAPTGEGKTECALLLAESSRAEGRGLYVALPTMATANGLIDRIDRYLQRAYPEGDRVARLLHSGAWLIDRPGKKVADPGDGEAAPEAEDWFATSKRGLLDPVGAGTIDQMLLAFLSANDIFVRLYALAGKTIIIDEVHAYDAYMQGILEIGLAWMRALDCRVILLSATLPAAKLQQLLNAWGAKEANLCPYPRITTVRGDGMSQAQTFAVSHRKPLQVQPLASQEDDALETAVHQLVDQVVDSSGTGVLVVNTVSRAQAALEIARTLPLAAPVEVHLFHARFTKEDRQRIEKTCLDTFGKVAPRGTPRLLIATQVVEQSLDLDFDFMISDLAPVDLLIQRAGRLHRHARTRKGELLTLGHQDERPDPTLFVLRRS